LRRRVCAGASGPVVNAAVSRYGRRDRRSRSDRGRCSTGSWARGRAGSVSASRQRCGSRGGTVGGGLAARSAIGGEVQLVRRDQVFGLSPGAVHLLVEIGSLRGNISRPDTACIERALAGHIPPLLLNRSWHRSTPVERTSPNDAVCSAVIGEVARIATGDRVIGGLRRGSPGASERGRRRTAGSGHSDDTQGNDREHSLCDHQPRHCSTS
jgi:hypothetical protein